MRDTAYGVKRPALALLCTAQLMVFLDATVVNVALPTIQQRLHFSAASLTWVLNAYLVTFGGFLLLSGRGADVFGRRRAFAAGLVLFTLASAGCAVASSQAELVCARSVQGIGGALISAAGLAMIVTLYDGPAERARAMGVFSFVASGGGTLGVILGGSLTQLVGWRSIFLVNLPIGAAGLVLTTRLLEPGRPGPRAGAVGERRLDLPGAVVATASVMLAILGCVRAGTEGWGSASTLGLLGGAIAAAAVFAVVEARSGAPLVPPRLLRVRELLIANGLAGLLRAAMFGWFFFSALYMQRALGFTALQTGLGYLPATLLIGAFSYALTARIVERRGVRAPLVAGALLSALGLTSFALAPADGSFVANVLPGMLLLGTGGGLLFMPLILAATTSAAPRDAGSASGLVSTSQQLGGAVGLAVLAALAASRARHLRAGHSQIAAVTGGFHLAFALSAALALVAAVIGFALLPAAAQTSLARAEPRPSPDTRRGGR